ncbi:MAG: hypothetical protein FJ012_08815 [Chloroflexi bacterium]|nr:hypothetical protein [Chloroflexota bacterium]
MGTQIKQPETIREVQKKITVALQEGKDPGSLIRELAEVIAFIEDDSFNSRVPCGIVAYTGEELKELFDEGKPELSPEALRLIHEAKKAGGGHVISHEEKG